MRGKASALILGFLVVLLIVQECRSKKHRPNFVFILADDLGWNDVSWHNPDVISPNLQELHDNGISLHQHYVQPICTPTRSALLTGFYPYKLGRQGDGIEPLQPTGLNLDKKLLPERLKPLGYSTHMVGKWHLGFCNWAYTPLRRGFDTFYGKYLGSGKYFQHTRMSGYDFRDQEEIDRSARGKYSTTLFGNRSVEIIRKAAAARTRNPFFLVTSFQTVHKPMEVPQKYVDLYPESLPLAIRKRYAMVTAMDEAVGDMVDALKDEGLFDETIIMFTSDDGGKEFNEGTNFPLSGGQGSIWEGGTRTAAFVHSPALGNYNHTEIFHVTDWYKTILSAAHKGIKAGEFVEEKEEEEEVEEEEELAGDGMDQWDALALRKSSPRRWMIYNLNVLEDGTVEGGLRRGQFKYMIGSEARRGDETGPWLFNIDHDPTEQHNLVDLLPEMTKYMHTELEMRAKSSVPMDEPKTSLGGLPDNFGGDWAPGWCAAPE
ncbi:arylsulfatase I-like [Oratosquilla oratoria]|uniref:arylsulfatase I-like n=1 Tax=Oratosquilla oratoria TaxID=337810 RepID=UPI003F75C676